MPRFKMYPLITNSILQLYDWQDQIDLDPPYQRISVWNMDQKKCFIDSVINGFDIPKLYFHEIPPKWEKAKRYKYAIIDGKQRMLALWDFMSNNIRLSSDFVFFDDESLKAGGKSYFDLMAEFPQLRARFDSFDVPITIVKSDDEEFIDQLFTRLNIQESLSAPERRNALGGPIPMLIRKVALSPFITESIDITNRRLQHYDLAAKFLYLTRAQAFTSIHRRVLDNYVTSFCKLKKQGHPSASQENLNTLESDTRQTLDKMHGFFISRDRLLTSQGRTTLYFHVFRVFNRINQEVAFDRQMVLQFDEELKAARRKSTRIALGADETLTEIEQLLVLFSSKAQSLNDGGALKLQYEYFTSYMDRVFGVKLPNTE